MANNPQTYLQKAEQLKLYDAHYWHLLLHMNEGKSEIDDPHFFVSQKGKEDAKAELLASLEALFSTQEQQDDSFMCKFPARTHWFKEVLDINELSQPTCSEYDKLMKRLDPQSATMVFSSAHINSPASMFGHTFLRIDSSYESKLLSYAVNYAAMANQKTENGFLFGIKGLLGGYNGRYSLLPYYDKLKEYTDTEQRDIWEYDLNLSHEEVLQMVRHIWELNNTFSQYFFFDENCSYNLLWLLEVARPTVALRDDFWYQVIPPETLFTLEKANLIEEIHYRPSKRTLLLEFEKRLGKHEKEMVIDLAMGKKEIKKVALDETLSLQQKQLIFESAIELSEYYFIEHKIEKEQYLKISHALALHRAKLGRGEKLKVEPPQNPLKGHHAIRTSLYTQVKDDDTSMLLGIRPAYHDISNSDIGFLKGTQIEFFDLLLKAEDEKLDLERLTLLSIGSYVPRSDFFNPFSWRTNFSFNKEYLNSQTYFNASVAGGMSWSNPLGYHYILFEPMVHYKQNTHFSLAPVIGAVLYETEQFKTNIEFKQRYYDDKESQSLAKVTQSWYAQQNLSLELTYDSIERFEGHDDIISVGLHYFF